MELDKKKKLSIIIGGLVLFFAILGVAGVKLTSQPSFCKSCHSMEAVAYDTWEQSSHKNIDCLACHADSGVVGLVKVKLGGLRQVWVTATGTTPDKIVAHVPNERCIKCHEDIPDEKNVKVSKLKELNEKANINYDHKKHLDKVKNCTECHARMVHQETKPTVNDYKAKCLDCHIKKNVDDKKCSTCHKPYHKGQYNITHTRDVKQDTKECTECHAKDVWKEGLVGVGPNYCAECHKVEMPHKPTFVKLHGAEFDKDKESCKQCHTAEAVKAGSKAKTCIQCHKVEMPHAKGYKDNHVADYKKNPAACNACHNAAKVKQGSKAKTCAECHSKIVDQHKEGNWTRIHDNEAKKNEAACTTCHSTTGKQLGFKVKTCAECHNQGHANGFIKLHESKYRQGTVNCYFCHKSGGVANTCRSCHKVSMPHPAGYDKKHGTDAKTKRTSCNLCHTSKNPVNPKASYAKAGFCTSCHAEGGHPDNWVKLHKAEALKTNGNACAKCHSVKPGGNPQSGWCYKCHQSSYSHPDGWTMPDQHGQAYLTKGYANCNICHVRENDCTTCHGPKW